MEAPDEKKIGLESVDSDPVMMNQEQEILELQDLDPALNKKMHLVNNVSRTIKCFLMRIQFTDLCKGFGRDWLDTVSLEIIFSQWLWVRYHGISIA
jgi:hypothetical protein